ncbi:MAG: diaminopimelate epimerase [Nitrospirae bacterium]|nr:diaminopimelate epimerase [Candidatus Manganitrophaceae bacterium]
MKKPIPFWKMSGSGNDFIMIDHRTPLINSTEMKRFIAQACRRGLSVGADGVILIEPSTRADYKWHYYNADGGEVEMCGNGSRCVARFAYLNQIAPAKHTIETLAGIVAAEVIGDRVRVRLPDPTDLRFDLKIDIDGKSYTGHFVNTGVPHVVYLVDDVNQTDIVTLGRATRHHPLFAPRGTNANFISVVDRQNLNIRTYERGVEDETLACGTGAIASAVITTALGKTTPPLSLMTRGQIRLGVDFTREGQTFKNVLLEGDARVVYKGELLEEALL